MVESSAQTPGQPAAGNRWIWPFELQEKIGEGGMGVVYRARYVPKDRVLAVKMLAPDVANEVFLARFERELDILKKLRHPNIVHCFGGVCEDKQHFYAMELVEGGTLDALLTQRGRLSWELTIEYAQQMCAGLQAAHERGVIHRDVKPGNFLMTRDGRLKLSDFGLATVQSGRKITAADKTMGTYLYMAPEQIRGHEITPRTDLYALGCVLFEMLTGKPPFPGQSPAAILHRHLKEPPPRVAASAPDCPATLEHLIGDMLRKDPDGRPASAEEVLRRLRAVDQTIIASTGRREDGLTNQPVQLPARRKEKDHPADEAAPPARRHSAWPILVATFLVAVLLAWNVSLLGSRSEFNRVVDEWIAAASSDDVEVRATAMLALGKSGGSSDRAVETLTYGLDDPDLRVRIAAAEGLGRLGSNAREAGPALRRVMKTDEHESVRSQASAALDAIRDSSDGGSGWLLFALTTSGVVALAVILWRRSRGLRRSP